MNSKEFLQRVLPATGGTYAIMYWPHPWEGQGKPPVRHKWLPTIDMLHEELFDMAADNDKCIYFAVSAYTDPKQGRLATNVSAVRAIPLDLDVGKSEISSYPTHEEAMRALARFCGDVKLPKPLITSYGVGAHCYWVFDRDLAPAEWLPIANALKRAAAVTGFRVDRQVLGDLARVMRPVGICNPKRGPDFKPSVILEGEVTTLEHMQEILAPYMADEPVTLLQTPPAAIPPELAHVFNRPKSTVDLSVPQTYVPNKAENILASCAQIRWIVENQNSVPEPLWYVALGIAATCENPEQTAIAWSNQYKGYTEEETLRKMAQWKRATTGPALCTKFESERPNGCKGCPLKGRIVTPAHAGEVKKKIDVAEVAKTDQLKIHIPINPPAGYGFAEDGTVVSALSGTDVVVSPFQIFPTSHGYDDVYGYEVARFRWNRPITGWQDLVVRQANLTDASQKEFSTAIADAGIVLNNRSQTQAFQTMLRAYINELKSIRASIDLYTSMGWKKDFTEFLIGDTMLSRDASGAVNVSKVPLAGMGSVFTDGMYTSNGSMAEWLQATRLMDQNNLQPMKFAVCVGFSTIYAELTGLKGSVLNLYGPSSTGKTLSQLAVQAIWGNPDKLHFSARFTQNAFFSRLGFHNHLPATIDEATLLKNEDIGAFVYSVSQGRDKARLTRNAEDREPKSWATTVITSSNKSFASMLTASGHETDAQHARLIDLPVPPSQVFSDGSEFGKAMYHTLQNNYGHAGIPWLTYNVGLGRQGMLAEIAQSEVEFKQKFNVQFAGHERYWENTFVLAYHAGTVAKRLGLIDFDVDACIRHALSEIGAMRTVIADSRLDAFDMIAEYVATIASSCITVIRSDSKIVATTDRVPHDGINGRYDLYRVNNTAPISSGVLTLARTPFRTWLAENGQDYKALLGTLKAHGCLATPVSGRASLGKDTNIRIPQTHVVGISLNHPRFSSLLSNVGEKAENDELDASLKHLKVV